MAGGVGLTTALAGCAGETESIGDSDTSSGSNETGNSGSGGNDSGESSNSANDSGNESGESSGEEGEDEAATAGPGESVLENRGLVIREHELVVESDEYSEEITVEGIIENTTDEMKDYVEVSARVYDADGNQLNNYWTNTTDLQAGGTWKFEILINEEADDIEEYDIRVTDSSL